MPYSNLHLDILMGRDETIEPADIFLGNSTFHHCPSNHLTYHRNGIKYFIRCTQRNRKETPVTLILP